MSSFFTVLMICILAGAEVDLFTPSFPDLQKTFDLSPFLVQLTLSVNFLSYCVCSLFAGTLGDRFSRKTVLLVGLLIFVLGSFLCVCSPSYFILILGRFLQGIGISGPAVLGYVIIADEHPVEKQPEMLGFLNGIVTIAMASAPVLGSYVNIYFGWRGNFAILLGLGLFCLILSYFTIPEKKGNPSVSLSPKAYLPLFESERWLTFLLGICFLIVPYWLFIGMAPILYMKDMGIELKNFGFYQGALGFVFATTSLTSSRILRAFGASRCLNFGVWTCLLSGMLIMLISLLGIHNPIIITGTIAIFSFGAVFPVNILYPMCLEVIPNTKSRTAAMVNAIRLILTAVSLEIVSFFYDGKFAPIGIAMFIGILLSFWFMRKLFVRTWIDSYSTVSMESPVVH